MVATSVADPRRSATATVTVVSPVTTWIFPDAVLRLEIPRERVGDEPRADEAVDLAVEQQAQQQLRVGRLDQQTRVPVGRSLEGIEGQGRRPVADPRVQPAMSRARFER